MPYCSVLYTPPFIQSKDLFLIPLCRAHCLLIFPFVTIARCILAALFVTISTLPPNGAFAFIATLSAIHLTFPQALFNSHRCWFVAKRKVPLSCDIPLFLLRAGANTIRQLYAVIVVVGPRAPTSGTAYGARRSCVLWPKPADGRPRWQLQHWRPGGLLQRQRGLWREERRRRRKVATGALRGGLRRRARAP